MDAITVPSPHGQPAPHSARIHGDGRNAIGNIGGDGIMGHPTNVAWARHEGKGAKLHKRGVTMRAVRRATINFRPRAPSPH